MFKFAFEIDGNAQDFVTTDDMGKALLTDALFRDFSGEEAPTVLWDAVDFMLDRVLEQSQPKKAIVLLTDGFDNRSTRISKIWALSPEEYEHLLVRFGQKEPETTEPLPSEQVAGAEVEELD